MSSEGQWYLANNGETIGPMTKAELITRLGQYQGENTMVYGPGAANWTEARHVAGLTGLPAGAPPPPVPSTARRTADVIDYEIFGDDIQFVEVTLDPGETVVAEAGNMMCMSQGIKMETVFGDPDKKQGLFDKVLDAGKRVITGESLFMTRFSAVGAGRETVSFAAPYPGKIMAIHLGDMGGELICQKDSFLAAARGIDVGIAFQKKILTGLFGGEGFILQRLTGDGYGFIHAGGCIQQRELAAGETLRLDTGCLVAFQPSVTYDIQMTGGIKNAVFGGEGLFLATLTGPGHVWIQSLPFSRLAARLMQGYARGKGEGSVLGQFGNLFESR